MGDDISTTEITNNNRQIRIGSIIFIHIGYNSRTFDNDIAMIRVNLLHHPSVKLCNRIYFLCR